MCSYLWGDGRIALLSEAATMKRNKRPQHQQHHILQFYVHNNLTARSVLKHTNAVRFIFVKLKMFLMFERKDIIFV